MQEPESTLKKRGRVYYLHYSENGVRRRLSLQTNVLQVARERQRDFESGRRQRGETGGPTRTPLDRALRDYVRHLKVTKTQRSYWADLCYLRNTFGPVCPELKPTRKGAGRPRGNRATGPAVYLRARYLEQITTDQIGQLIRDRVEREGIGPKTANRYREVISRLFSWSMKQNGVRMAGNINPGAEVERYRERAPEIRYLSLDQVAEQLHALECDGQVQTMVAVYIFAGLRREEAVWLQMEDVDLASGTHGVIRVRAKTVDGIFWQPKTGRNRNVPISRALRAYLDRYTPDLTLQRWYFPSPAGARWNADCFAGRLRELNVTAGLSWSCLDFRHTFGTQLVSKGESLYKVSALMGNSPEICRKHYAALLPESLADSVEFAPEVVAPKPVPPNVVAFKS